MIFSATMAVRSSALQRSSGVSHAIRYAVRMASTTSGAKPQSVRRVDITAAAMFEGAEL
jgi:hypothetical protein